jgi:hypothetical protein
MEDYVQAQKMIVFLFGIWPTENYYRHYWVMNPTKESKHCRSTEMDDYCAVVLLIKQLEFGALTKVMERRHQLKHTIQNKLLSIARTGSTKM